VVWDEKVKVARPVKVHVQAVDQPGVLADICGAITAQGGNIGKTQVFTTEDKTARCDFEIEVFDRKQLDEIMSAIGKNKTVLKVERVKGIESPKLHVQS